MEHKSCDAVPSYKHVPNSLRELTSNILNKTSNTCKSEKQHDMH